MGYITLKRSDYSKPYLSKTSILAIDFQSLYSIVNAFLANLHFSNKTFAKKIMKIFFQDFEKT